MTAAQLVAPVAVSTVGLVFLILGGILVLFFIGGLVAVSVRSKREAGSYGAHVRAADQALQQARASDRGWDKDLMEGIAKSALSESRPDMSYKGLHLVLVEDRPGMDEDRAHFVAVGQDGDDVMVILGRQGGNWVAESVR
jgi:hypothetical protein